MENQKYCNLCSCNIRTTNYTRHCRSVKHMNEVIIREFQNEIANEEDLLLLAEEERQLQYLADLDYCRKIK